MDDNEQRSCTTGNAFKKARLDVPISRNVASSVAHVFCEHCNQNLSVKTFRRHHRLYFNEEKGEWTTTVDASRGCNTFASEEGMFIYVYVRYSVFCFYRNGGCMHWECTSAYVHELHLISASIFCSCLNSRQETSHDLIWHY